MAKGQKRSNKEVKKPKADKNKPKAGPRRDRGLGHQEAGADRRRDQVAALALTNPGSRSA